mmetsp:Transcript_15567/g.50743  ORF Transcript_15567/g.50743 Transcript_15567/m.50743 type:complete len:200 (+) Transcript_15567:490-1089(+)
MGPRFGFVFVRFLRNAVNLTLLRTSDPDTQSCSQRTTTTFWPQSSSLAMMLARRPSMCVRPSTRTLSWKTMVADLNGGSGGTASGVPARPRERARGAGRGVRRDRRRRADVEPMKRSKRPRPRPLRSRRDAPAEEVVGAEAIGDGESARRAAQLVGTVVGRVFGRGRTSPNQSLRACSVRMDAAAARCRATSSAATVEW